MAQTLMCLYTESPLHAGSGGGLGTIDLPIQRERHTDFPVVQGSGIKGALRSLARSQNLPPAELHAVFGPDTDHASDHAGAITVGDARLLLFPVRSLRGVFAWATTPLIVSRLQRDVELVTGQRLDWSIPREQPTNESTTAQSSSQADAQRANQTVVLQSDQILVPSNSAVLLENERKVVLEEYTFDATPASDARTIADTFSQWLREQLVGLDPWLLDRIASHLVILPGAAFRDFVLYSTEVVTRVRLNETKTVETGGLWTEESLPTDSLLYSPIMARKAETISASLTDQQVLQTLRDVAQGVCQFGGDTTVGRGLVRPIWFA